MAHFYMLDSAYPIKALYISSSGDARFGMYVTNSAMGMRAQSGTGRAEARLVRGSGRIKERSFATHSVGETTWDGEGLDQTTVIRGFMGDTPCTEELPVMHFSKVPAIQSAIKRLGSPLIKIDLDSHVARTMDVSDIVGEGILFAPTDPERLTKELTTCGMFHHDDRANIWGRLAASATVGEGYREISTPSLHFAVSEKACSVHVDSYAFMVQGPEGIAVISPDVGQHIVDELFFRKPMPWMRRHSLFAASVLQALHPVLPNSTNNYAFRFGLRLDLGGSGNLDIKRGVPRLTLETTIGPLDKTNRWHHSAELRVLSGGSSDRDPDYVLTVKVDAGCRDVLCRGDHQSSVGLILKGKVP
jgi:hypothetical protein